MLTKTWCAAPTRFRRAIRPAASAAARPTSACASTPSAPRSRGISSAAVTYTSRPLGRLALHFLAAALTFAAPLRAQPQSWAWDDGTVPYVNTPVEVVERMMRMAEIGAGDSV